MNIAPLIEPLQCEALVVGGGIAGCWTALKLAERGVDTILVCYQASDRGGRLGSSQISVGAINTSPITRGDYSSWLEELGRGQMQTSIVKTTMNYLADELEALKKFDPLKTIELGYALASGSGKKLIDQLMETLETLGVRIVRDAWITAIEADELECRGVHYQLGDKVGVIQAASLVLAAGGYSGLFQGAVKTGTFGSIHGRFLLAGGKLSNLEFIFKHGYGQPDLGKLTPTEELPGVEIYDTQGTHVAWLEEELFYGRGTHNHFQAFMTWRKDENTHYFVDFRFRDFHRQMKVQLQAHSQGESIDVGALLQIFAPFVCVAQQEAFIQWLVPVLLGEKNYDFNEFNQIKYLLETNCPVDRHRIRQIAYFSMGGMMHHGFLTNLKNVFVNGEAMHDYGAHRVGGLPWALYLTAARKIGDDIQVLKKRGQLNFTPIKHSPAFSQFDGQLLALIQEWMFEFQERGSGQNALLELVTRLRDQRQVLDAAGRRADDAYAYLLLAEGIALSSLARQESRGCFFRSDFPEENFHQRHLRTLALFDSERNQVVTNCVDKAHILDLVANRGAGRLKMDTRKELNNGAYFLLKKHLYSDVASQPAIVFGDLTVSYIELNNQVERYAHWLFTYGLNQGDRVAIWLTDSPEWVALFIACLQLGLVAVPLNSFAKEQDLVFYLNDSQASLLVTEQLQLAGIDLAQIFDQTCVRILALEDLLPLADSRLSGCIPVDEHTIGFMLYTSGSTGRPKGALHSHANLLSTAQSFGQTVLEPVVGDKFYSSSRLFFAYGLGNSLTFPLYFGCTSVLTPKRLNPPETLVFLDRQNITHFFSIPSIYAQIYPYLDIHPLSSSVRLCVSAGEPLSRQLGCNWASQTKVDLVDGLGSTEALHIFCCTRYCADNSIEPGKAVTGYELQLLDDSNFVIEKNEVIGNLAVRGASLAHGYWQQLEASGKTFVQDLLLTGDQYQRSSEGGFLYVGRKGDTFKTSGLWVSAFEVEQALLSLEYIAEAALVIYIDSSQEQKTAAFVVPKTTVLPEELYQWLELRIPEDLAKILSRYKLPRHIYALTELPRTSTGKVAKPALKELAQAYDPVQPKQSREISPSSTTEVV